MKKEFLAYTIPIGTYSYMLYDYYANRYKRQSDDQVTDLEKKENIHEFLDDIDSYCPNSKNDCLLSHNITEYTAEYIKKYGIDSFLDKVNRKAKVFQTDKEYVFIYKENEVEEENERGNLLNVYHVSPLINKKYAAYSTIKLQEKCGKGKCELLAIMKQIKEVSDKYENGGFIEYYWFDPKTQETIIKKSFVMKVSDVEYEGKKTNLYIGSGHTVKKIHREHDFFKLNLLLVNSLLFITAWIFFNISNTLKNNTLSFMILIFASFYLSSLMFDSYKVDYSISEYEKQLSNIMVSGQILATFTGSLVIYLNLIKQKQDSALYQLLVITLLFTLFSSIYYTSKDRETVGYIYLLKNVSVINASLTLFLTFILVTLKKILK